MSVTKPTAMRSDGDVPSTHDGGGSDPQADGNLHGLPIAAELGLTALLASDQAEHFANGGDHSDAHAYDGAYDGHVALALDPGVIPDIDATLDLLTSSHDLFDVPAMDLGSTADDALPT